MKLPDHYTSGEFARMAHISIRTIRFYDKQGILKPSYVSQAGTRFYSDTDFARLQQILLLKYLGFSLEDIKNMTINDTDYHILLNSLNLQLKLVQDRMEQMQLVEKAIKDTVSAIEKNQDINWSQMLELIHLTNMEKSIKTQYQNATNITSRINLHKLFAVNKQGWFPWLYENCAIQKGMRILEIGCGNGALWTENLTLLPKDVSVVLSDLSEGMLRDARRSIGQTDLRFSYQEIDCHYIPYADQSFDLIIANHVLFYCHDLSQVLTEVKRVLKPQGRFLCSTYGFKHMKEINQLVHDFDSRIALSAETLYEKFGLENGLSLLKPYFSQVQTLLFHDYLLVNQAEPLIEYILSCHGNQNQFILDRYKEFRVYVDKKVKSGYHITKDAGIFVCSVDSNIQEP